MHIFDPQNEWKQQFFYWSSPKIYCMLWFPFRHTTVYVYHLWSEHERAFEVSEPHEFRSRATSHLVYRSYIINKLFCRGLFDFSFMPSTDNASLFISAINDDEIFLNFNILHALSTSLMEWLNIILYIQHSSKYDLFTDMDRADV